MRGKINRDMVLLLLISTIVIFGAMLVVVFTGGYLKSKQSKNAAGDHNVDSVQTSVQSTTKSGLEVGSPTVSTTQGGSEKSNKYQVTSQTSTSPVLTTDSSQVKTPPPATSSTPNYTPTIQQSTIRQTDTSKNKSEWIYGGFHSELINEIKLKTIISVEIFGIEYIERNETLRIILNRTGGRNKSKWRNQWALFPTAYAQTIYNHIENNMSGEKPKNLRVIEFNSSDSYHEKTFFVSTETVREYLNENISWTDYNYRWFNTIRNTTESEDNIANRIGKRSSNRTFYPNETMIIHDQNESEDQNDDGNDSGEGTPTTTGTPTSNIQPPRVRPVES